ncbi:MAG: hypothetical protein ACE5G6_07105 [Terriglobia bacterium]
MIDPLRQLGQQMVDYLPQVFAALVLLVAGAIVGWVVKQVVYHLLRLLRFDHLANRLGLAQVIERVGLSRGSSYVVGQFTGLFVILVAVILALNALGPTGSDLVQRFFSFLPHLLIAVLILVVGGILAAFIGRGALIAAVNARLASARLLAGAVRVFIWLLATIVALEHLGIGRTTLAITFAVLFGGLVTGVAIAFGMAGKDLARQALDSLVKRGATDEDETGVRHL